MRVRPRLLGVALSVSVAAAVAAGPVPDEMRVFARALPAYFSNLEEIIARETITQTLFNDRNGLLQRRRVLVSDYQIAHLGEDPAALWEFRFIRSVDGRTVPGVDRKIDDFFRLRHPSAEEERRSIVNLAAAQSLPGCYWHNLTLVLLAFGEGPIENFEWTRKGSRFLFRQVRGLGIPEDFFDPRSPRHYPTGSISLAPDGRSPTRLELEFPTDVRRIRVRLDFTPPSAPEFIGLPRLYVVESDHATPLGFNPDSRTRFEYSDIRRYSVSTAEDALPARR